MHLTFNVIGTLLFALFLNAPIAYVVTHLDPTDVGRQIANTHTLFNIINVIIQLPFSFMLIKIATWLVPDGAEDLPTKATKYLDDRILETPAIAFNSTVRETLRMGKIAKSSYVMSMNAFFDHDEEKVHETFKIEKTVNELEKLITEYLVKLSNKEITESNRVKVDGLFNAVNDIERIGDHADNIAELVLEAIDKKIRFSEEAVKEIKDMHEYALDAFTWSLEAMKELNRDKALAVIKYEEKVDHIERTLRRHHIDRLNRNECTSEAGIIYNDLISNIERVSDLSANIARLVLDSANEE